MKNAESRAVTAGEDLKNRRPFFLYSPVVVALFAAMVSAGCAASGPSAPTAAAKLDLVSGDEQPGFSGAPLEEPLIIRVLDIEDQVVAGASVTWSVTLGGGSVSPSKTTTDANGLTQTTWTLGLTAGPQVATGSIAGVGTVTFSATANPVEPSCDEGTPYDLAVGGSVLLVGPQASEVCVAGGTGRDYVVVAFNSNRSSFGSVNMSLTATGVVPVVGPPRPDPAMDPTPLSRLRQPADQLNHAFHLGLREIELRELAPMVRRGSGAAAALLPGAASFSLANPVVGETFVLNTSSGGNGCSVPPASAMRTGRVAAISQRAIVVEDLSNPSGGFTTSEYQSIAATFDTLVYPADVEQFGEPSDIDRNNRVLLFYTGAVNELTPQGAPSGFVAGFFFSRDLFPKTPGGRFDSSCPGSNVSEMMYLMVPDPAGTIHGNPRSKDAVRRRTLATLAHELEHLINSSRRLYVNTTASFPERAWVEEALAHSAEELVFYRASGLSPLSNIAGGALGSSGKVATAFNEYQVENILRTLEHLDDTNGSSAFQSGVDLATRGAGQWFFRYLVDRVGGNQSATWRALVNGPDTGFRNIEGVIQADPMQWMRDWSVSHYVDDAVSGTSSRYRMLSWNLRSLVQDLSPSQLYPVRPPEQANGVTRSSTLISGGSEFFRFGVPPGGEARVVVSAGVSLPTTLSIIVVRTR